MTLAASFPRDRESWARTSLAIVLGITALNLLFNLVAGFLGYGHPYDSFLWRADDSFGDFFSLLSSYPEGKLSFIADREGIHAILPEVFISQTLTGPEAAVTNHHMMPFSTLLSLTALEAMRVFDPVALFLALCAGLLAWWFAIASGVAKTRREALTWSALGVVCYPMLLMMTRGNLHAGLTAMLVLHALTLALRRKSPLMAAALLALAVNIRPNAILLAVPLFAFNWNRKWPIFFTLGLTGSLTLMVSFLLSNAAYPSYTIPNFLQGLKAYSDLYVIGHWGIAAGSSLYGLLRVVSGGVSSPAMIMTASLVSLAILAAGVIGWIRRWIDDAALLFVCASAYCLGSAVFADYHLLVFLIVPIALAQSPSTVRRNALKRLDALDLRLVALLATCLILAPKNYVFGGIPDRPVSLQVVLNPAILSAALALILGLPAYRVYRRTRVRAREPLVG